MYNQNNELKCRYCKPPERHPGCQSHCPHYQEWKKKHDEEMKQLKKEQWYKRL